MANGKYMVMVGPGDITRSRIGLANHGNPMLRVRHSDLELMDGLRRACPLCKVGTLLVQRNNVTFGLEALDYCILCAQKFEYVDIEDILNAKHRRLL